MPGPTAVYLATAGLFRNARRSETALRGVRERKLRRLLAHAYDRVPYYRALFDAAGLKPRDIRTVDELAALPVTTKAALHDLPLSERTAAGVDLRACRQFSTSGTTGIPLTSFFTRRDVTLKNLSWLRAQTAAGLRPWHRTAVLTGGPDSVRTPSWYEALGLYRRREISSRRPPAAWLRELAVVRPDVLMGYVMTLRILAEEAAAAGVRLRPRAIFHSSALLDDLSRRRLGEAFGCRVVDFYGSDEAGCIAWECPRCSGYHVAADMVIVEIVRDGRPAAPGEEGEVVITNLHSEAMPFIRYRQEDVAVRSAREPACGRRLPLLEGIRGRIDDFIILPGRRRLTPHVLYHALDHLPGIRRWRIVQEDVARLRVDLEPLGVSGAEAARLAEASLRRVLPEGVQVRVVTSASLAAAPGTKFRAIRSLVTEKPE